MSLKPWRTIAQPHKDVLHGTFKQSEFAADITQVALGTAPEEYQDAEKFFARTYITEGMRLLLISVAQRLAGQGGDPVIQLQTAFGGGKTHTMLAVYHLASRKVSTDKLMGIPPLLDQAKIQDLPHARIAVLDGIRMAPSQAITHGDCLVNTLWGELAWQLLGEEGYALVASSDADGTSPGKEVLQALLARAAPCVILIDELVAFVRQLEPGKQYKAGTFDSNISFIQGLTEALKAVPNALLLASLPESELEVGGNMGLKALNSLEKYFARVESVWKPVGANESFEIVRRRLFDHAGERAEIEGISRQFSDFYRQNATKFPTETQSNEYFERLCASYPIHPEVFDRLYEDWSTLDKFQRTRGVLQYMAIVIHRLWVDNNQDALIMPGTLPLNDSTVKNKSIHYLPQGWEPVIEREVDGSRSVPADLDGHKPIFGSVQAATRTARTLFLGSAPSSQEQGSRGIEIERILLGAVQPGQSIGIFEDVLKHLRDRLHYLYSNQGRYWLDTRPNLRREMESRKQNISDRDELLPLLKDRLSRSFGNNHHFAGIHVFTPSQDVPDDYGSGPRLVVLPASAGFSKTQNNLAYTEAEKILKSRGEQPRQKQNRLIFLAADFDVVSRLKEQGRTYLAWSSIVRDIESSTLNHDMAHLTQAKNNKTSTEKTMTQQLREAWRWLIAPRESFIKGKPTLEWESVTISPASANLVQSIEEKLREEEWVVYEWSPIHLRKVLQDWYFKGEVKEISALKVWQDSCNYLYLPRLANDQVFRNALNQGVESTDYFGFATAKEEQQGQIRYLGFTFGSSHLGTLDEYALLIERETAAAYALKKAAEQAATQITTETGGKHTGNPMGGQTHGSIIDGPSGVSQPAPIPNEAGNTAASKTRFYGTTQLDPVKAKMDFATLMDEVVQQFTEKFGVEVNISIEIEAKYPDGFDEGIQRTIRENCKVLNFSSAEFDED
ncbi:MAG: ATP-binding protein [Marinospirillum sp.]|uniref:ATP-binding protein n=1 Tax=Marinospirillum sp. TaxID=2183934 RepID=UPI0019ED1D11|nr:DUF499 domain-containing protein [Marinospirillum sp.]MBE0508133.1 ATP-binding protein [Marinospirillum sp.]